MTKNIPDYLQPLNDKRVEKKIAYYQQPQWKGRTHVMDLPSPIPINIDEVKDGKVTSTIIETEKPFTVDDWTKMHEDAIENADKKLKSEWDAKRKEKTTLRRLFKELNND